MTRIVSVSRLRPRLVATFALVAALTSAAVAVTSYYITREAVLRRAESVAERVLGLPPEPRTDKDVPFRDVPRGI